MYIGWRPLTSAFEDENEFIFIDRPGYGLSDDVREDMTIYIAVSYFGEYAADYDDELIPYAERLGNTEIVDLPGDHVIFLDRTEECIEIIDEFLNDLG